MGHRSNDCSEVKLPSSIDRFLVVFHSPRGLEETGLPICPPEKIGAGEAISRLLMLSLQCGSRLENRELAGISRDFSEATNRFLCSPDFVAEGEGFEPSVRF